MALRLDSRTGARILAMRPASRAGLYALASCVAGLDRTERASVPRRPSAPAWAISHQTAPTPRANDSPCWPDGPSAA